MYLDREWPILVNRKELFFWTKVVKNTRNVLEFLFVLRVVAGQNLLGFPVTITSIFNDLSNIGPRYWQTPLCHNRVKIR